MAAKTLGWMVLCLTLLLVSCRGRPSFRSNAHTPCQDTISHANNKSLGFIYDEERFTTLARPAPGEERIRLVLSRGGQRVYEGLYDCTESESGSVSFTATTIFSTNR